MPHVAELLIASLTPQNLERGALWFTEHHDEIKKARHANPWWRENTIRLEADLVIKPSLLVRWLTEFGYERAPTVRGRGIYAVHGGLIEIWPINSADPWLVEFIGNAISSLTPRERPAPEITVRRRTDPDAIPKLPPGSHIVHIDHGIGIFRGSDAKYFVIEYAPPGPGREPDRLLVPIDQKDRLTPYIGFGAPIVHRLGGTLWYRTKRKVREDAEKLARSLAELYAKRHRATRPSYAVDPDFIRALAETFSYDMTPGQLAAEEEILRDLARDRPMDRILCGDVGFGKTEIAIRAAAAVISSGRQVAMLAPTTVLAAQHERTFNERLARLPITVRALSRLTAPQDQRQIIKGLAAGKVDCLIGTHRLLSSDIVFPNLGLIIIDEEQRFGVKQKERFKEMRSEVDILSLSATPIPRTLSFTLAKLRDISLIDTPPAGRIPIVTAVLPWGKKIIREAIRNELARQGQVYVLHNRIETIGLARERLQKILAQDKYALPRIGIIHGRMPEGTAIRVMDQFRNRKIDVLLATTLIENGLDISSANTLIVEDASRLGLAQAHQLRGRIGRGLTQAYAYFLYRPHRLTAKASGRLEGLKEYADLGAGYDIALRDLEIRGAGNILGREQSGAINKVGLNLYYQILAEAVETIHEVSEGQ